MSQLRVGVLGASGETGSSIVNALIADDKFSIVALTRPSSASKPVFKQLQKQGVELREIELSGPQDELVKALADLDILISAINAFYVHLEIPLADAAKKAGVKRFVPCAFMTVMPPVGRSILRDSKEKVYNHIKLIRQPYTIIDVGFWYQFSLPRLESGKIDGSLALPRAFYGSGNVKSALTDLRDVGRYVAKIIADDRTLNKYVFAYNELRTQNEVFNKLEELSGEKAERQIVSEGQILKDYKKYTEAHDADPDNQALLVQRYASSYALSMDYCGDNQPEYAKYLGYLVAKDLYPDFDHRPLEHYIKEVLNGTAAVVYSGNEALAGFSK